MPVRKGVDRAHDLIGRRAVGRAAAQVLVEGHRLAHEDMELLAAKAREWSRQPAYVHREYGSAAADREHDDPALGFSGGSAAFVGALREDPQRPTLGQQSECRAD